MCVCMHSIDFREFRTYSRSIHPLHIPLYNQDWVRVGRLHSSQNSACAMRIHTFFILKETCEIIQEPYGLKCKIGSLSWLIRINFGNELNQPAFYEHQ